MKHTNINLIKQKKKFKLSLFPQFIGSVLMPDIYCQQYAGNSVNHVCRNIKIH